MAAGDSDGRSVVWVGGGHVCTIKAPSQFGIIDDGFQELTVRAAPDRARYVRVRARSMGVCPAWHPGAGDAAWVFADEIRVNGE